jgi:hypothetical protein
VDEDEQDGAPDDDYMNNFGGGMGGGDGGFGGIDFSKLGGGDMGGLGDADDDVCTLSYYLIEIPAEKNTL